jgi:CubicO group peptidase (beta-lactamase class C family)
MAEVSGTYDERFVGVAEALARNLDEGLDVGASVAVTIGGEYVVDIWGGWVDAEGQVPWERDTVVTVFSTSKTMTALCALILADRGELDLHAPVTRYWPEFAAAGKAEVEVRHLLGHTAGLSGWDEPLVPEDLADWERCTTLLAAQPPWWEPGSASGYHSLTMGYLVGEVVRRVAGVSLGEFFRREVGEPLGADFHIGLPASEEGRLAALIPPPSSAARTDGLPELGIRTFGNPLIGGATSFEDWWRRAEIPAVNGHGNARSVAAIQSVIAGRGQSGGVRLLSAAGTDAIFEVQADGVDLVLGQPTRLGMGYGLANAENPIGPRACYWGGYGGSVIVMDQDADLTVCYVMNRMEAGVVGDPRGDTIVREAVKGLG